MLGPGRDECRFLTETSASPYALIVGALDEEPLQASRQ
jgi:hypothetical protein